MIRIGTRGSALALTQARTVAGQIPGAELVVIESSGPPSDDKARWTSALETAMLSGEIELAIHSAKDVPAERPPGIVQAAVPTRADARDAICGAVSLEELPEGAKVGTSSPRREASVRSLRPDLEVAELRGNVDTRLRRLDDGDWDAIVLAAAGLERLGLAARGNPLDPDSFLPAAGQGCLLVEGSAQAAEALEAARAVNDPAAEAELAAERAVVVALGADCHTAVAAMARHSEDSLTLDAAVFSLTGTAVLRQSATGSAAGAAELGAQVAAALLEAGASELLAEARGETA